MTVVDGTGPPRKKPTPPRIFTNTEANLLRSIERLSRWVLKGDISGEEVQKVRASTGLLRLRVEMARLAFDRERWVKECEIEQRLEQIEQELQEQKR